MSFEISQAVQIRITKKSHKVKFLSCFQITKLEIRQDNKVFISKNDSLYLWFSVDNILNPLNVWKLPLQENVWFS